MADAQRVARDSSPAADADMLGTFSPAFVFFDAAGLVHEYRAITRALPHWGGPRFRPPAPVDGSRLAVRFARALPYGEPPGHQVLLAGLATLGPAELFALANRLHRLRRALDEITRLRCGNGGPLFAVPPVWSRRWEMLIRGRLLPAAVGVVDLDGTGKTAAEAPLP